MFLETQFTPEELFTVGLFSTMDAILDIPMKEILEKISLSEKIKDALLGKNRIFNQLNDLITKLRTRTLEPYQISGRQRFQTDSKTARFLYGRPEDGRFLSGLSLN